MQIEMSTKNRREKQTLGKGQHFISFESCPVLRRRVVKSNATVGFHNVYALGVVVRAGQ